MCQKGQISSLPYSGRSALLRSVSFESASVVPDPTFPPFRVRAPVAWRACRPAFASLPPPFWRPSMPDGPRLGRVAFVPERPQAVA